MPRETRTPYDGRVDAFKKRAGERVLTGMHELSRRRFYRLIGGWNGDREQGREHQVREFDISTRLGGRKPWNEMLANQLQ